MTGRGLYELRPEWNKHFNLYFHHYSRADQSKVHTDQVIDEVSGRVIDPVIDFDPLMCVAG